MRLRLTALALTAAALGGCGSSGPTIPESKLPGLVLKQSDLPRGFAPFYVGKQLRADQTPRRSDPQRFGREGGWIARFHRGGSLRTRGPLVVASRADLFKGSSGARKDLQLYEGDLQSGVAKQVEVPKLGDETIAAMSVQPGPTSVRTYLIAWRRDNATAEVDANGFGKRITLADVLALARKQDARLRRAAG
jgi:hypothetical protein